MMYLWYTLKFDIVGINVTKELNLLYSIACPSITSSTASCLSATSKLLHFLAFTAS